jgi:hypothetical protein
VNGDRRPPAPPRSHHPPSRDALIDKTNVSLLETKDLQKVRW